MKHLRIILSRDRMSGPLTDGLDLAQRQGASVDAICASAGPPPAALEEAARVGVACTYLRFAEPMPVSGCGRAIAAFESIDPKAVCYLCDQDQSDLGLSIARQLNIPFVGGISHVDDGRLIRTSAGGEERFALGPRWVAAFIPSSSDLPDGPKPGSISVVDADELLGADSDVGAIEMPQRFSAQRSPELFTSASSLLERMRGMSMWK